MLTADDLAIRASAIGASEAASVCGIGPGSAFEVFARLVDGASKPATYAMRRGVVIEPLVADLYAEATGLPLAEVRTIRHARYPFLCASLDREVPGDRVVEIKAPLARSARKYGPSGSDLYPREHLIQVTLQCAYRGLPRGDLAVLVEGEEDVRIYPIPFDAELAELVIGRLVAFWRDHILTRTPPPIDASDAAKRYVERRYAKGGSAGIILPAYPDAILLADELRAAKREAKAIAARGRELESAIKARIGNAEAIEGVASWKRAAQGAVSWKSVAIEAGATKALIDRHRGEPGRRFALLGGEDDET